MPVLKRAICIQASLSLCFFALTISSNRPSLGREPGDRPNIIFILADDLGWSQIGCYGNGFNETPNVDQLAKEGMRFTDAYAAAPVCSPYRASFLTGLHPARVGIIDYLRPNSANALSTANLTLPEVLREHGYATGMIGKWHLTGYRYHGAENEVRPSDHGFDWDIGCEVKGVGNGANFWPYVFRDQDIRWLDFPDSKLGEDEFLIDRMNIEAVEFIERHHEQPFFLYLSHYGTHSILNGKPQLVDKYRAKHPPGESSRERCYLCQDQGHSKDSLNHWAKDHNPHLAAMLESIDDGVGLIREKLDQLELTENTIIVFTSDNGGETNVGSNAPLRGGKSQLYEGGIRVPLVTCWPGKIPQGTTNPSPTSSVDFYPTLLSAAGIADAMPNELDGVSMLPTWLSPEATVKRDPLIWHYPLDRPHFLGGRSSAAIRSGTWKLIEYFDTRDVELFSLETDLSELADCAADHPEVVRSLRTQLENWRLEIGARVPSPPLLVEARQLVFADHFSADLTSDRWWFNGDWIATNDELKRTRSSSQTTRVFLRNAEFGNALVRFDFQFHDAQDIRLVTGSNGPYNTVIHVRKDHFFIQTAMDKTGPYFSYRHGECAYEFKPDQWYTMTVEFLDDQVVAHIDHDHTVYARHPIITKTRTYFAFQVDDGEATFDNVQLLNVAKHPEYQQNLATIEAAIDRHPVDLAKDERLAIEKRNAHERLYQSDPKYRLLVQRIEELDELNRQHYPDVFRTHKETRKAIQDERKRLLDEDPVYKELLFATYRAYRAIEEYLVQQKPEIEEWPDSQRKWEMEQLRLKHQDSTQYQLLVVEQLEKQRLLEEAYPNLFVTDEEITESRQNHRAKIENDPDFREAIDRRAAAWREQQTYLHENDARLKTLSNQSQ